MDRKRSVKKAKVNPFQFAVESTPQIRNCLQSGLRGLGTNRNKVNLTNNSLCDGSVEIDECVRTKYPNDNRWDYVLGYKGKAYFVEVHSANSSEVSVVIRKLKWLKQWLNSSAPELNKIKATEKTFTWIQSNGYHILKNSSYERQLAQNGIIPISRLDLD